MNSMVLSNSEKSYWWCVETDFFPINSEKSYIFLKAAQSQYFPLIDVTDISTVVSVYLHIYVYIYIYIHIYVYAVLITSIKETIIHYSNKEQKYIHEQQIVSLDSILHDNVGCFVYVSLYE